MDVLSYISKLFGDSEPMPPGGPGAVPSFAVQRARLADNDTLMQTAIAPLEHREFAQEFVQENPVIGPISMLGAIPAYSAYKALSSKTGARTKPSMDQVFAGFEGVYRGMKANFAGGAAKRAAAKPTVMAGDPFTDVQRTLT